MKKITSSTGSKHSPYVMNNLNNIFIVLYLIVFAIMVEKSSFLLASDLSLVVSEFFVSRMLTSTSWGVDSVSRMLMSCSSALDLSDRVSQEFSR